MPITGWNMETRLHRGVGGCDTQHTTLMLILPYERFTKGEEDKPLPPAKPRKLEAGPQEGGVAKTKAGSTVKRSKEEQSQKPKGDKDTAAIVLEPSASQDPEDMEKSHEEGSQIKTDPPQIAPPSHQASGEGRTTSDEEEEELHLTAKEEVTQNGCAQEEDAPCRSTSWDSDAQQQPALSITEDDDVFPVVTPEPVNHSHPAKDLLQKEQAELVDPCTQGTRDQTGLEDQCHVGMVLPALKQKPQQPSAVSEPEPPSERAELPPREDSCSSHSLHLFPHRVNPGIMSPLAKKKLLSQVSGSGLPNHNHYASYGPPPPLISKALTNGSTEEPAGQPATGAAELALIHRPSVIQHAQSSKPRGGEERREGLQRDTPVAGETYPCSDLPKHHPYPHPHPHSYPYPTHQSQPQTHHHHHPQHHHSSSEPYLLREEVDRVPEMPRPGQTPSFLSDFYSSPHLHSLYRQTEQHLAQGQTQGHGTRLGDLGRYREACLPRECETSPGFSPTSHPQPESTSAAAVAIGYGARMSQGQDKMVAVSNREKTTPASEDQPTDLSLPKLSPHKHSHARPHAHTVPHHHPHQPPTMHQEVKGPLLFQSSSPQGSGGEYHPRACRVLPMTMTPSTHTPRQALAVDPNPRTSERTSDRTSNSRGGGRGGEDVTLGGGYKVDELRGSSRSPILNAKISPHNVCAARPLKRTLEELENHAPERKIRAVTPMHSSSSSLSPYPSAMPKDVPGTPTPPLRKARSPELDSDLMVLKPGEATHTHANLHISGFLDGHKFPLHSAPLFPGLYPGAFVSHVQEMCDSLGPQLPHGYPPHPLQYLKNQAVLSPIVPPFAIHSFMMQRQLLAQAATSPAHMYRHPMGASYGELLHHGLYPMSALNSQPAFNPPQLSSVHPSTKLS